MFVLSTKRGAEDTRGRVVQVARRGSRSAAMWAGEVAQAALAEAVGRMLGHESVFATVFGSRSKLASHVLTAWLTR